MAFIDTVEVMKDKKFHKEYFSKLVKADVNVSLLNFYVSNMQ